MTRAAVVSSESELNHYLSAAAYAALRVNKIHSWWPPESYPHGPDSPCVHYPIHAPLFQTTTLYNYNLLLAEPQLECLNAVKCWNRHKVESGLSGPAACRVMLHWRRGNLSSSRLMRLVLESGCIGVRCFVLKLGIFLELLSFGSHLRGWLGKWLIDNCS